MNHTYRLIWSEKQGSYVPAPETARRRGKRGSKKAGKLIRVAVSVLLGLFLAQPVLARPIGSNTLPTGGEVIHGQASISQNANQMNIHQGSDKAILHWQGFDIGRDAQVNFAQPSTSSVALNRVVAGDASQIHGQLTANGQVWLVNPKGVVFGQGSRVDVGGLVVTTLDTTNQDFLDGKMNFTRGDATGSISNQGEITTAEGGLVALLAPEIINDGLVSAQMGNVVMAGGDRVSLDAGMNGMLKVAVDASTVDSLIENRQMVKADGGQVIMTSKAATELVSSVITNKGRVQARTMVEKDGRILLLADMDHGQVHQAGILDASAPVSGDGGFIETSAATVKVADGSKVTTRAEAGQSGTWLIDPNDYTIGAGGNISGATLSSNLSNTSITIDTASEGTSGGNGDIHVNDTVSWSKNKLTLTADQDININAVMTATDTAELEMTADNDINTNAVMTFSDSSKLVMTTGSDSDVKVGIDKDTGKFLGRVDFGIRTGKGFLTINGKDYTVINSLGDENSMSTTDLQGMRGDLDGHYALGGDILDASTTAGWNSGAGFTSIGTSSNFFEGTFNGLGHVISGLTINLPTQDGVGLFGYTRDSTISNVGLENVNITGQENVGGLVGKNGDTSNTDKPGHISNSYVTGKVTGEKEVGGLVGQSQPGHISSSYATADVTGYTRVGGLVGYNAKGQITQSYTKSNVEGNNEVGGLVGYNNNNGQISDSHATGPVTGTGGISLGGLVGSNAGTSTISESYATGTVTSTGNTVGGLAGKNLSSTITHSYAIEGKVTGQDEVGGLVGYSNNQGVISDSYAEVEVEGRKNVGGLVGENNYKITNSYATGLVTGTENVGGLVGCNEKILNTPQIINSYATGKVVGGTVDEDGNISDVTGDNIGGLVGYNEGQIKDNSYATGQVTGKDKVGGLVGWNWDSAQISNSYATGIVEGNNKVGGLVGCNEKILNTPQIINSYATGTVTGTGDEVGGLVGSSSGKISESYTTGQVMGTEYVGGLVGENKDEITDSYATGQVTGTENVGGLVGANTASITNCFWDTEKSEIETSAGGEGKTTAEMKTKSTFTDWSISNQGGDGKIWRIYEGQTYPLLSSFLKSATGVTVNNDSKTYDANPYSGGNELSGFDGNMAHVFYSGNAQGAINADTYTIAIYSDQQGYDFIGNPTGTLTIDPTLLNVSLTGVTKTYDGSTTAILAPKNYAITDWVGSDVGTITQTSGSYDTADADTGKTVTVSLADTDYAASAGTDLNNYILPTSINGVGVIAQSPLSITANDASKTYDGLVYSGGNGVIYSGFVNNEDADVLGGSLDYGGSSQGAKNAGAYDITPEGLTSTNYAISFVNGRLTIKRAPISYITIYGNLTGTVQKTYDGTSEATLTPENYVLTGWVSGQGAQVSKTRGSYDNANAGTGKLVTVSLTNADYAPNSATNLGNYYLPTSISGNVGVINPAPLTIMANDHSKIYDGLAYSGGNGVRYSGFVNNEDAGVLSGSIEYTGSSQGAKNAGSYAITPGGCTATNYSIDYIDGTLAIAPAPLTVSLIGSIAKIYDGSDAATLTADNYTLTGWQGNDGAQVTRINGNYDNANADTGKLVSVSLTDADYAPNSNTNLDNYNLPTSISGNVGVIDPVLLTITANDHSKIYDGLTYSGGNGVRFQGFVNGETLSVLGGNLSYSGSSQGAKNAGTYVITPSGYTSGNYNLDYMDGILLIEKGPLYPYQSGTQQRVPGGGSLLTIFDIQSDEQKAGSFNMRQGIKPLLSFAPDFIRLDDTGEEK